MVGICRASQIHNANDGKAALMIELTDSKFKLMQISNMGLIGKEAHDIRCEIKANIEWLENRIKTL